MPTALVLGSASSLYVDAAEALKLFTPDCVAACNNTGKDWEGHVHHWFTLHITPTLDWVGILEARRRRKLAGRNDPVTWAHKMGRGVDRTTTDWGGSTGLFAVKGLMEMGFDQIVLAGVPMTIVGGHYFDKKVWAKAEFYHKGWLKHKDEIAPFCRSMSGWTRDLLGHP